ncbi:hypothetical protein [Duganella sp. BuS-21]|uniref:hypothetical protein n=1 Tax=Duganella sp. BuS-21 TaxID=2943848 RepID=UPI0035A6FEDF
MTELTLNFDADRKNIRIIAVAPDGTMYVSRRDQGDVLMLKDVNQDGLAEPMVLGHRTTRGSIGYYGPRAPEGDPAHHCHFQIFTLDTVLSLCFASDRDQLLQGMRGHVLAKGEIVARYAQAQQPLI